MQPAAVLQRVRHCTAEAGHHSVANISDIPSHARYLLSSDSPMRSAAL